MAIRSGSSRRTTDEWEGKVGEQVRDLRQRAGLTQEEVAKRSNVSVGALQNLEYGAGSRLATLIQVTRALGRGSWLEELAPPVSTSPMQLLNERRTFGLRPLPDALARSVQSVSSELARSFAASETLPALSPEVTESLRRGFSDPAKKDVSDSEVDQGGEPHDVSGG